MAETFVATALVTALLFLAVWAVSVRIDNAGIVDIFWGPGFAVIAWTAIAISDGHGPRALLIACLVTLWALRLGFHLLGRNLNEAAEDKRYAEMRRRRGESFKWWSLYMVFGLQAVLMWIVSLPVQVAIIQEHPHTLGLFDFLGALVFLVGLIIESVADAQLTQFKADPANEGKVLDKGLWAWSRHPNYFGDTCVWWGLFLIALSNPYAWWTIIGPALMTYLILRVSGVRLLERGLHQRKSGYAEYMRNTSAFIPLPPKRD